ncbi:MAG: hypothetical protein GY903_08525 [Fuerstiella sp.]|nr:hypothetical protein [Fuerstiella sp.]MCP4854524.1 hypothetical protein [Fuerstiella sp.]
MAGFPGCVRGLTVHCSGFLAAPTEYGLPANKNMARGHRSDVIRLRTDKGAMGWGLSRIDGKETEEAVQGKPVGTKFAAVHCFSSQTLKPREPNRHPQQP